MIFLDVTQDGFFFFFFKKESARSAALDLFVTGIVADSRGSTYARK